ncbi:GLR3.2, partial [Symbiodinium necroappetens]
NVNGYNAVVWALRSNDINEPKGTNGCQVYNSAECDKYPLSCKQPWCYVDIEACKVNQQKCQEAHLRLGAGAPWLPRIVVSGPAMRAGSEVEDPMWLWVSVAIFCEEFSYETCGALGSYNEETRFEKWMANLEVQAAVDPSKIYPNEMLQELINKSFTEFDFLNSTKRATTSQTGASIPILNPTDQSYWETQAGSNCSQDESGCFVCNSGYSKCVHDVAVGKFDLCIADLWITPCRSAIAQFLPPVRFDMFYLVQAAKPRTEVTPGAIMERPFKPFTPWAWAAIGIFILLSALCFLAGRHLELVNQSPPAALHRRYTHDLLDLIGGQRSFGSSSRASCKVAGWGFAWGMLVLTSTYTANLTDILALERKQVTSLQRLEDAKDMSICVDEEALSYFSQTYHTVLENVTWRPVGTSKEIPQLLHEEKCSAAVMYQEAIDRMHAGEFAGSGRPSDYDCKIRKVPSEEVLLTFAVGFPVAPPLAHGLSWALTSVLEEGTAAKAEIQHRASMRASFVSKCGVEEESEKRLDWPEVLGALIDAFIIVILGALIFGLAALLRGQCCRRVSQPTPAEPPVDPGQPPHPIE